MNRYFRYLSPAATFCLVGDPARGDAGGPTGKEILMNAATLRQPGQSHVVVRRAADRGATRLRWLDSRHSFSFGEYMDREHLGFRTLRVLNDDRVAAGGGFPPHGHREMEIFSYVLAGALEHRDSMGNARVLKPGEIQLMSAGTGVMHSEFNPSGDEPTHFLQIWIQPERSGLSPRYTEWQAGTAPADERKVLVVSGDGRDGSAVIRQDADVYRLRLGAGDELRHELREGRGAWLQVIEGTASLDGVILRAGDGASTERAGSLAISAQDPVHALLFDLR